MHKHKNRWLPTVVVWLGGIAAWTFAGWGAVLFFIIGGVLFAGGTLYNQASIYAEDPDYVIAMIRAYAEKFKS